ncbi:hypothetical protein Y032_0141g2228 [Ancylostoma ceylanicum]|uniref:PiggyBac transposable element-derived protein domain-containing protein n=1 Tax=Ancylostoma ceylanicum TaxID=53326 RepID=A0A016T3Q5_9BILA|nr:hypothetical protein Y032_0141g2228 [Ancylostoma ceylanicum]
MAENGSSRNLERFLIESEDEQEADTKDGEDDMYDLVVPFDEDASDDEDWNLEGARDEWCDDIVVRNRWPFEETHGVHDDVASNCKAPIDFFKFFLNEEVLELVVRETNRYGCSKNMDWVPTNSEEISKLIGLTLQMEIVRLPSLASYWSDDPVYGCHHIGPNAMPRYRFEELVTNLHLCDNNEADRTNRFYRISEFLRVFNKVCQEAFRPGQELCIYGSLVPLKGFLPDKDNRYDVKLFKICTKGGYTYRTIIHAGEEKELPIGSIAEDVVMPLLDGLLDSGRVLFTDDYYTSIPLAETLIARKTNLVGPVRRNSRGLPLVVAERKLKRGEHITQQKENGVTVLKYRGTKNVLMLSTMHDNSVNTNGTPNLIEDYHTAKSFFNVEDQKASYNPYVRRTTKWYQRIFFHLITKTALVNSWRLFCDVTGSTVGLVDYKISVIKSLLPMKRPPSPSLRPILEQVEGPKRSTVRRCVGCYTKICAENGSNEARKRAKRVHTRCSKCKRHYCIECFQVIHTQC